MTQEKTVKGYKATDKNMQCRGFQFELGKWYKHDGEIAMCESGFHFCEFPSGPWCFYSRDDTRIFRVEAKGVVLGEGPGADLKHVAMEIRLTEEIFFTGDGNTGHGNTGDGNTGDGNTGDGNTGDGNTGNWNTGHWKTGDGNATDKCSGHLCMKEQPVIIFDKKVIPGVIVPYWLIEELSDLLSRDEEIDNIDRFLEIPNATKKAIMSLHHAHIERRKSK